MQSEVFRFQSLRNLTGNIIDRIISDEQMLYSLFKSGDKVSGVYWRTLD